MVKQSRELPHLAITSFARGSSSASAAHRELSLATRQYRSLPARYRTLTSNSSTTLPSSCRRRAAAVSSTASTPSAV
jgi:hypothetical protein